MHFIDFAAVGDGQGSCDPALYREQIQKICRDGSKVDFILGGHAGATSIVAKGACRSNETQVQAAAPASSDKTHPPVAAPFSFAWNSPDAVGAADFDPTFNYRGDEHRLGEHAVWRLPKTLHLAWRVQPLNVGIHSASKSSPAVDDTGVYVGSDDAWFYKFTHDGKKAWSFYAGGSRRGIHATAALDQKRVYVSAYNGYFYALSKKSGRPIWMIRIGDQVGSSALLKNGFLYLSVEFGDNNGYVCKVKASDGSVAWCSEFLGEQPHSSVSLATPGGNPAAEVAVVGCNSGKVFGFDGATGKTLWTFRAIAAVKGTGAVVDGRYIFGAWDGYVYAIDARSGALVWKTWVVAKVMSSPAIDTAGSAAVFSTNKRIISLDLKTGKAFRAQAITADLEKKMPWGIQSGIVLKDKSGMSQLVMQCEEKTICGMDVKSLGILWKTKLPEYYTGVPAIWDNSVYLALESRAGLLRLKFDY